VHDTGAEHLPDDCEPPKSPEDEPPPHAAGPRAVSAAMAAKTIRRFTTLI
jgi:hypothetical protein